jgi:hypothetical protein
MAAGLGSHMGDHLFLLVQSSPVGAILLIIYMSAGPSQSVMTTVVAAPSSMTTMGLIASASDHGLLFEDIWEPSVLSMCWNTLFDHLTPHCLLLAKSSGTPYGTDPVMLWPFLWQSFLSTLFFPTGEALADMVATELDYIQCQSIFFPEVCAGPIGPGLRQ